MWIETENGELYNLAHVQKLSIREGSENWFIEAELGHRNPPSTGHFSSGPFPTATLKKFATEEEAKEILQAVKMRIKQGVTVIEMIPLPAPKVPAPKPRSRN